MSEDKKNKALYYTPKMSGVITNHFISMIEWAKHKGLTDLKIEVIGKDYQDGYKDGLKAAHKHHQIITVDDEVSDGE